MDNIHRLAWDLIPWVVNGSASEAECREVESHRQVCADCQAEFAFQQQLAAGMGRVADTDARADADRPDVERALWRFWAEAEPPVAANDARPRWLPALAAAAVLQAVGLAAALGYIWLGSHPAEFHTLSQPEAVVAGHVVRIRLVPAPGLQIGELRALLARSDLQLVQASPDAAHLGLAPVPGARFTLPQALQRLRAEPGVLLAEPLP